MRLQVDGRKLFGCFRFDSPGRIRPTRTNRWVGLLFLTGIFILLICSVFIRVQQIRYGREIQQYRAKVAELSSDVRELRSRKAELTSYRNIQTLARELGMVYPRKTNRVLTADVPKGTIPPTWNEYVEQLPFAMRSGRYGKRSMFAERRERSP